MSNASYAPRAPAAADVATAVDAAYAAPAANMSQRLTLGCVTSVFELP